MTGLESISDTVAARVSLGMYLVVMRKELLRLLYVSHWHLAIAACSSAYDLHPCDRTVCFFRKSSCMSNKHGDVLFLL